MGILNRAILLRSMTQLNLSIVSFHLEITFIKGTYITVSDDPNADSNAK